MTLTLDSKNQSYKKYLITVSAVVALTSTTLVNANQEKILNINNWAEHIGENTISNLVCFVARPSGD